MKTAARILIAEDESAFRETAAEFLRDAGYEVEAVGDGKTAWEAFRKGLHDVVLSDIRMPGLDGLELLLKIKDLVPAVPVIIITAHGSIETAIKALRLGAIDYLQKPCDLEELCLRVKRVLSESRMSLRVEALERDTRANEFGSILGESDAMQEVFRLIQKVAPTTSTVLIAGESGTGKELVAREIHRESGLDRFVPINCGAIPENLLESELFGYRKGAFTGAIVHKDGLFRVADGGTLFLDEVGELPASLQVKILRTLDNGEIQPLGAPGPIRCEPRIVAATNKSLEDEVKAGRFREDLFYRLHVFEIRLPPLRERREDIPLLADHFIEKYARKARKPVRGIRPDALRALVAAPWRGNIRELENVIERAIILADGLEVTPSDLPLTIQGAAPTAAASDVPDNLRAALARYERDHILRVIEKHQGDKRAAAQAVGIGLSSLYRKIE